MLLPAKPHFRFGRVLMTPGAIEALQENCPSPWCFLIRHMTGDWGDLDAEVKRLNDEAVKNGSRILSSYTVSNGAKVWVITEADRSSTTILLPDEY